VSRTQPTRALLLLLAAAPAAGGCIDAGSYRGKVAVFQESPRHEPAADVAQELAQSDVWVPDVQALPDGVDVDLQSLPGLQLVAVSPASGTTLGNDLVMLVGAGFKDNMDVFFGDAKAVNLFVVDANYATCQTPVHAQGTVDVSVQTFDATAVLPDGFEFVADLTLSSVDPVQGDSQGGTPVVVEGTGFGPECDLFIGTRKAFFLNLSGNETLAAVTPPGACGDADVRVQCGPGSAVLKDAFAYVGLPHADAAVPPVGPVEGGFWTALHGKDFTPWTTVTFNDVPATKVTYVSPYLLDVLVPPGQAGPVTVGLLSECGAVAQEALFAYVDPSTDPLAQPAVLAAIPDVLPACAGGSVTLALDEAGDIAQVLVFVDNQQVPVVGMDEDLGTVTVVVPPSAPGSAQVLAVTPRGNALLDPPLTLLAGPAVTGVEPGLGPPGGGILVNVEGCGFAAKAEVRFGPALASWVVAASEKQLIVKVPPGSPGPVDVSVYAAGGLAVLPAGFTYTSAGTALYFLDPNSGSRAGGTYVRFVGDALPPDGQYLIDGKPCFDLQPLGPGLVAARTPPNAVGTYDVSVASGGKTVTLPQAFTYFNPRSSGGGTWGGPIDESVNVSVVDGSTGSGLPGALVMLGTELAGPHQGYTNEKGQITFSEPGLMGKQTVTAAKPGYSLSSVVHYNAANVTLFISPISLGSGSYTPYTPPQSYVGGRVHGLDKYVIIPPGSCAGKMGEGSLCKPCATDADCNPEVPPPLPVPDAGQADVVSSDAQDVGPDAQEPAAQATCAMLGDQGQFCATPCLSPEDCPDGFLCAKVSAESTGCIPAAGEKMAKCMSSKSSLFGSPPNPGTGAVVNEHQIYFINTAVGEIAIVCYGGYVDPMTTQFVPTVMGIRRHVVVLPNEVKKDQDVTLSIPLTGKAKVAFHDLPSHPSGIYQPYLLASIELGKDGYLSLPREPVFQPSGYYFLFDPLPAKMSGPLEGATFSMYGSIQSKTMYSLPYAVRMVTGLPDLSGDGIVIMADWGEKTSAFPPVDGDAAGIVYRGPEDYFVATGQGELMHWDGLVWTPVGLPGGKEGFSVLEDDGAGGLWVGGKGGTLWHFDGTGWTVVPPVIFKPVTGIRAWGDDAVVTYPDLVAGVTDAVATEVVPAPSGYKLGAVWASDPDDVWIVSDPPALWTLGKQGYVLEVETPGNALVAVDGSGPDDVWVAGSGLMLHWNGNDIETLYLDPPRSLTAVSARKPDRVFAAGLDGALATVTDGEVVWLDSGTLEDFTCIDDSPGSGRFAAAGIQAYNLGPYMAFPRILEPQDGAVFTSGTLQWTFWTPGAEADNHYIILSNPEGYPYWTLVVDGEVTSVPLPPMSEAVGAILVPDGSKRMNLTSSLDPEFDIDHFSNQDFSIFEKVSWSVDLVTFE